MNHHAFPATSPLHLFHVEGFDENGIPSLRDAPPVAKILATRPVGDHPIHAICTIEDGRLTVLAYARAPVAPDCVTLGVGLSRLHLHADGRIRIEGSDIRIEADGRLGLAGGSIDLN